jgi:ATP-binding cassette subfamily B protein
MGWRALHGSATLGDLVLFYQVFAGGQSLVRGVTGSAGQVYSHTLFVANLFHFLDLKPSIVDPAGPVAAPEQIRDGIRLEAVSFTYPGSNRPALHDFNLYLPANGITAVVGPNGAGKSTLIKLLSRFYDPDSGSITIDGIDLRDLKVADLRSLLTILFQVPVRYDASARENIALGFNDARSSEAAIRAAARAAGIDGVITSLPNGYDTLLGKSFEHGAELSAGEWQRIAMARALLRPSPLVLMDEPTSAMDSWAEADWFERIRAMTKGRTVLLITHRFTIAKRADLIHVMQAGEIVESGTHHDLLALEGLYASSWHEQIHASLPDESPVELGPIATI